MYIGEGDTPPIPPFTDRCVSRVPACAVHVRLRVPCRALILAAGRHSIRAAPLLEEPVVLDSVGAPHEPPNSLNNRDAANVQLPDDDYDLSVS